MRTVASLPFRWRLAVSRLRFGGRDGTKKLNDTEEGREALLIGVSKYTLLGAHRYRIQCSTIFSHP